VTLKSLPSPEGGVSYTYDLLNRMTGASQSGYNLTFGYDVLGRQTYEGQGWGSISRTFDLAGRVSRLTWWDGFYVDYDRLVTGEVTKVRENGATSGIGLLASYAYDDLGRRTSMTRGNGAVTIYGYDAVSRLTSLTHDLSGTANDLTVGTMTYNPASQILSAPKSNDAYSWNGHYNVNRPYTANGLNQHLTAGSASFTYSDGRGNLTSDGTHSYTYWSENRLKTATGGISLYYDPLGRLSEYDTTMSTRFMYDGSGVAVEVDNPAGNVLRRYVRGDGPDEVLVWYEGPGTTDRRFLHADERGSIVAVTDSSGAVLAKNSYDEHGIPGAGNLGKFQYTGQMWLSELGTFNYRARIYSPTLGRFLQTDPIGYGDGPNWYAYTHNDPVNGTDPLGLCDFGGGPSNGGGYSGPCTAPTGPVQPKCDTLGCGNYWGQPGGNQATWRYSYYFPVMGDPPAPSSYVWTGVNGFNWTSVNIVRGLQAAAGRATGALSSLTLCKLLAGGTATVLGNNIRSPDYYAGNINITIPTPWTGTILGWSGTAAISRNGDWFWSPAGGGVGKSSTGVSASVTANWMNQSSTPSATQLNNMLSSFGTNASVGYWGGVSESWTPGAGTATGFGFVTPQGGLSANYSFYGGNVCR
jgi:RHS repeat-associated protein